ncbi:MADS-box transcription factor 26-like isoform X2 [Ananas comosus]|uniref:MADS-box transcription factor 26-like isoform X2 n=1 Tax=Ananas comosus TaxID=4615 RepID=A0A6P5EU08_ANACO|nr:MADS-box transcription factor 26-like isoform X2 [Ananas comosus]
MARGKVQMKRIENPVHRQVTFCKRRAGLLKKARELSVLCDADIGIIIFSTHGKLYDLATKGTMEGLIERYKNACGEVHAEGGELSQPQEPEHEVMMLKQEINLLQKGLRYMFGDRTAEHMALEELLALERHLEIWMYNIRAAKMQMMFQEIQSLKNKIVEQNGFFDIAPVIAQQNGHFAVAPVIGDHHHIPYNPLTIQNDYYSSCRGSEMGYSY